MSREITIVLNDFTRPRQSEDNPRMMVGEAETLVCWSCSLKCAPSWEQTRGWSIVHVDFPCKGVGKDGGYGAAKTAAPCTLRPVETRVMHGTRGWLPRETR